MPEAFKFPDEKEETVDASAETEFEIEGEEDIEVVDDTPEEDRGRERIDPPEDVTEEELTSYSNKVKTRIQHFARSYHDERRAKEAALREREELERIAQKLLEENRTLKGTVGKSQTALVAQAKRVVENELNAAKAAYRTAYENGDADKLLEAEDKLAAARTKVARLEAYEKSSLQKPQGDLQQGSGTQQQAPAAPPRQPAAPPDPKAQDWAAKNTWFGQDDEMTAFALGVHNKLVKDGVDPRSDAYYERLNTRIQQAFPEQFGKKTKGSNVVAPATRSSAPKKVRLTKSQVAIAKRLGVPLAEYAKQVAEEIRREAND